MNSLAQTQASKPIGRMIPEAAMPLFTQIHAGHRNAHFFSYYLEYLAFHMPVPKIVPALQWLVKNKICGERFIMYVRGECRASGLEFIRNLHMRVEREKKLRELFVKDIRL